MVLLCDLLKNNLKILEVLKAIIRQIIETMTKKSNKIFS